MTDENILNDLKYIKELAEDGARTPLVGGRIGLMWGVLLASIFFLQWSVLSENLNVSPSKLWYFWASFAVIGGFGSSVLGKQAAELSGANSVANRVDSTVWGMFALMMTTLFIGIFFNIAFMSGTPILFSLMLPVGFAGQGLAYGLVSTFSNLKWMKWVVAANFIFSILCFVTYGLVEIYLIGAIGIVLTVITPSIMTIRKETGHVN